MKQTSCKKLKYLIKEESESSKDYFARGFVKQSREEKEHSNYFKSMYKKRCNK